MGRGKEGWKEGDDGEEEQKEEERIGRDWDDKEQYSPLK